VTKTKCHKCARVGIQGGNTSNGWSFSLLRLDERTPEGFQKIKALSICPDCTNVIPVKKKKSQNNAYMKARYEDND